MEPKLKSISTSTLNARFQAAAIEWRTALGDAQFIQDHQILKDMGRATFRTRQRVAALLIPTDVDKVSRCLAIANEFQIPVYPISGGHNWGFGSRVPYADNCVIIDLKKLNKIYDYNDELGYVTPEPGVTFQQVEKFLLENESGYFMSAGAVPHGSVIANTLENGHGRGPMIERANFICGLEVVLPSGKIIHTGMARYPGARVAPLTKWGIGPSLDSLFMQSNLGIVTKMTLWLSPNPHYFRYFKFSVHSLEMMEGLIETIKGLKLQLDLKTDFSLSSDFSSFALRQQYPWDEMGGQTPLSAELRATLRKKYKVGIINGEGAICASNRNIGTAEWKIVKNLIKPYVSNLSSYDEFKIRILSFVKPVWKFLANDPGEMADKVSYSQFLGWTKTGVSMTYWRKKFQMPSDPNPERDSCGTIMYFTALPVVGPEIIKMIEIYEKAVNDFGLEIFYSFHTLPGGRVLRSVANITYDREVEGADELALGCYNFILQEALKLGIFPIRRGLQNENQALPSEKATDETIEELKDLFDPHHILAPGKKL